MAVLAEPRQAAAGADPQRAVRAARQRPDLILRQAAISRGLIVGPPPGLPRRLGLLLLLLRLPRRLNLLLLLLRLPRGLVSEEFPRPQLR